MLLNGAALAPISYAVISAEWDFNKVQNKTATICLNAARAAQFKDLAARRGVTVGGLVEQIIADAIAAGELPDTLPGYYIAIDHRKARVSLAIEGEQVVNMSQAGAQSLAEAIATISDRNGSVTLVADVEPAIEVRRVGAAVALSVAGSTNTIGRSVASDLIRQVRKAADSLAANTEAKALQIKKKTVSV
ncbi:hypothetical protein [Chelatococcus reniformis]|uniref:Uncharacterized protein n=1 Tax=Chelatococcus reniformis TaxID=1494448 RepID=A0A916UGK4_9HYPH|nr:hypothetical protein [Chelatococcus reniformis]GGC72111.1 hypothetical protein GCM10010994_33170 [Chelatococcus reniformis]